MLDHLLEIQELTLKELQNVMITHYHHFQLLIYSRAAQPAHPCQLRHIYESISKMGFIWPVPVLICFLNRFRFIGQNLTMPLQTDCDSLVDMRSIRPEREMESPNTKRPNYTVRAFKSETRITRPLPLRADRRCGRRSARRRSPQASPASW